MMHWFDRQLLDYEPKAADQVPLLMRMKKDQVALEKAILSGDTDLGQYSAGLAFCQVPDITENRLYCSVSNGLYCSASNRL